MPINKYTGKLGELTELGKKRPAEDVDYIMSHLNNEPNLVNT